MLQKINENLERKDYVEKLEAKYVTAYRHRAEWIDYLISEKVIFSHRNYAEQKQFTYLHAPNYYKLVFYKNESGTEYIGEGGIVLTEPNMLVLTKPLTFHMVYTPPKNPCERYVIYFMESFRYESGFDSCVFDILNSENNSSFIRMDEKIASTVFEKLAMMESALIEDSPYSEAFAKIYLIEILANLSQLPKNYDQKRIDLVADQNKIFLIKNYIDSEYANIKSISELSEKFFYSREHITREFKRSFNTSIYHYILNRKLLLSKKLLLSGISIERAAQQAGFTNISAFIRLFKKNAGMTPSEYQKKVKKLY